MLDLIEAMGKVANGEIIPELEPPGVTWKSEHDGIVYSYTVASHSHSSPFQALFVAGQTLSSDQIMAAGDYAVFTAGPAVYSDESAHTAVTYTAVPLPIGGPSGARMETVMDFDWLNHPIHLADPDEEESNDTNN